MSERVPALDPLYQDDLIPKAGDVQKRKKLLEEL